MIVEACEYSAKYNLVILTIAGEDFSVDYDCYNDLGLSLDDEVDFDTYKIILANDEKNRAKNFALAKISYAAKSSFEVKKLLRDNDFSEDVADQTIDFLEDFGLIDDDNYVASFVADKHNISRWSKNKIRYALKAKNLSDELIEHHLATIPREEEMDKVRFFAQKKARGDFSKENKQKVYRYLAGKGFDFDLIGQVLGELFK